MTIQQFVRRSIVSTASRLLMTAVLAAAICPCRAESPAAPLQKLGAKVTESDGVVTQVQINVDGFTQADYRVLGSFHSLKKLTISGKSLDDTTLPLLAGLTELEELSASETMLTDNGYRHFAPFQKLRSLSLLHASWELQGFTGAGLAHLQVLPKLERLTFAVATTRDEALAAVGTLTQLREFRTWHTSQTQDGNLNLLKLTNLKVLKIGQRLPKWTEVTPASFDESTIPLISQMKSLERLELTETRLSAKGLMPLKELPDLKQLVIREVDISAEDIKVVRKELPRTKVYFTAMPRKDRELLVKKLMLVP